MGSIRKPRQATFLVALFVLGIGWMASLSPGQVVTGGAGASTGYEWNPPTFDFGFTDGQGNTSDEFDYANFSVTEITSQTYQIKYSYTATAASGGASSTATMTMDWGQVGGGTGVAFTNVNIGVTQSNPNGSAVTAAQLDFSGSVSVGYLNDTPGSFVPVSDSINTTTSGTVGPHTGDYDSYSVSYNSLSASAEDNVPNTSATLALNQTSPVYDLDGGAGAGILSSFPFDFNVQVLDPGGSAGLTVIGATSSAVPEPASASLLAIGGLSLVSRRKRGKSRGGEVQGTFIISSVSFLIRQ
jgi:hypothetical protein